MGSLLYCIRQSHVPNDVSTRALHLPLCIPLFPYLYSYIHTNKITIIPTLSILTNPIAYLIPQSLSVHTVLCKILPNPPHTPFLTPSHHHINYQPSTRQSLNISSPSPPHSPTLLRSSLPPLKTRSHRPPDSHDRPPTTTDHLISRPRFRPSNWPTHYDNHHLRALNTHIWTR